MTIFGYARVSTRGQTLETQIELLKKEKCDKIFTEKYTGTKMDRKEFSKLLKEMKSGDTFVATKLDRFARSTVDGLTTVQSLFKRDIRVNILNMGVIENTPTGQLILTQMLAFAQFERDMIVERTQEGKAHAKKHKPNYKEGRPIAPITPKKRHAYDLLKTNSYREVSKVTGFSKSTLQRIKKRIETEK
ncbi:recombinase family protein [Enterococcus sp. AZ196]|uniref:recombinase family protein n=1 Tax=Enterococcus sp. AZ196 TaxID=2774659 RepID=UPI003D2D654B